MATLNTMRAILKDARMREQAGEIRKHLRMLHRDVELIVERVGKLIHIFAKRARILTGLEQHQNVQASGQLGWTTLILRK